MIFKEFPIEVQLQPSKLIRKKKLLRRPSKPST